MRLDLPDLRLFLAIFEAGSITRGAAAASLSLAAASERLREMESTAGVALFERVRRGVVPTRAGEALAHHARAVLRQVGAMHAELSEHARGIRGSIRVLANSVARSEFLPDRLAPFLHEHPRIDIDLDERGSVDIVKAVSGGLAEIGIVSDAVSTGALEVAPFADDRLVAVMAKDHVLAARPRLALADLADEDLVAFDGALQRHVDAQADRAGLRLRYRLRLPTFDAIGRAASTGGGIGVVPETAARRVRRVAPLAIVRLADAWAERRLVLVCAGEATLDRAARRLLAHLARGATR